MHLIDTYLGAERTKKRLLAPVKALLAKATRSARVLRAELEAVRERRIAIEAQIDRLYWEASALGAHRSALYWLRVAKERVSDPTRGRQGASTPLPCSGRPGYEVLKQLISTTGPWPEFSRSREVIAKIHLCLDLLAVGEFDKAEEKVCELRGHRDQAMQGERT